MKKVFTLVAAAAFMLSANAQAPERFSYQSIVRDADGLLLTDQDVGVRISITHLTETGDTVYSETHAPKTNKNGLMTLQVGAGISADTFSKIDWSQGPYFIVSEIDPEGGSTYSVSGASELLSVPYALHANTVGKLSANEPWAGSLLSFDGTNWVAKRAITGNTGGGVSINNMMPYLTLRYCIALQGVFPSRNGTDPYLGEIMIVPYTFPPRGWADCNGQLLAISQYSALFSLLGTNYGGDGRTTFGIPDLRGRAAIHTGQGPGLSTRNLASKGGSETNTLNVTQLPAHSHSIIIQ